MVAPASAFDNNEKVKIVRRVLAGLAFTGIRRVRFLPDSYQIVGRAADGLHSDVEIEPLQLAVHFTVEDTVRAAGLLAESGAACIVTLGGDGTNRAVAKACGDVPLIAIATGTNNVFPQMVDGTLAGIAAGLIACGHVPSTLARRTKRLEIWLDGELADIALVDVAISQHPFIGTRAIWDLSTLHELVLARTEPGCIGLSSIGAHLCPLAREDERGLHIHLGDQGQPVSAILAPGMIRTVRVQRWRALRCGDAVEIALRPCTVAVDGERELHLERGGSLEVRLTGRGPRLVDVREVLWHAARAGLLRSPIGAQGEDDR
ncbi:NAD(+)/NADH kinase [Thermomicrobiaceae bacterium CFH 74404]|uniref:NAD(+)/NADH kinase n=1 Tax=Thermalbibacter longus TaxID=2951981 RepID=A0AA42B950_9BACT|nr:NAD(+)/NADH kinase [Thermalbibacter longus]